VTLLAFAPALAAIVKLAVSVVLLTTVRLLTVTPAPDTITAVAPDRFVPVSVTATAVPRKPLLGLTEVSVGPTTVNAEARVALPLGVWTVTLLAVSPAVVVIVKVAVTVVEFTTVKLLTVMPAPDTVAPVADPNRVPVIVTATEVPRKPVLGATPVTVGVATVNVTGLLVPPAVATVTFRAPSAALLEMLKVAVTVLGLTTVTALTVMPPPETVIPVTPDRLVPVSVTGTLLFRPPVFGAIEVKVGAPTLAPWNSTAPTSKAVGLVGLGRGFPKKSVVGCTCATGMASIAGEPCAGA
jgi:hypothetical protein